MVFHWSLSDSKFSQVSRTLLSTQADLNNAVVWMISSRPLNSKPSGPNNNPLLKELSAPITIGITVNFVFHSFLTSLARYRYLSLFSLSFNFTLRTAENTKSTIRSVSFFFFFDSHKVWSSGWDLVIHLCISFSRTDSGLCIYHFYLWSNLNLCTTPCGFLPLPCRI